MSPRFILGQENVPCVAEVVNRSLKADCTDFTQTDADMKFVLQKDQDSLKLELLEKSKSFNPRC